MIKEIKENLKLRNKLGELQEKYGEPILVETIGAYEVYKFDTTDYYTFIKEGKKLKSIIEDIDALGVALSYTSYCNLRDITSKNK